MTALLPSLPPSRCDLPRSSRNGPDRTRRACSAEATSVARGGPPAAACWDADTHLRGWSLLSPLLAAGQRARARVADERERADRAGWDRDGPSLASQCACAAERAAHADTDGHASSSSADVPWVYRAKLAPQRQVERAGSARIRAVKRAPHRQRASLCRVHESTPTPPALCAGAGALSSRCARAALALRSRYATHTPASEEPEPWATHGNGGSSPSSFLPSCCHCAVVTHVAVPSS